MKIKNSSSLLYGHTNRQKHYSSTNGIAIIYKFLFEIVYKRERKCGQNV